MQDHLIQTVASPSLWTGFLVGIAVLLGIDLAFFRMKKGHLKMRDSVLESVLWVSIALSFNLWFGWEYGTTLGIEFLTGYIVEKSLSVDNLFVILMIFQAMHVQKQHRHKVLFLGILGAVLMRGGLIILGASLIQRYQWILYGFGAILIFTAIKFLRETDEEKDFTDSIAVRVFKKFFPLSHKTTNGSFFVMEKGIRKATPLFLALVLIETTDLIFAFDSIPAVFAVTRDPFIAFASNILAVLGMRAFYFVIADLVAQIRYLKPGLAVILGFVGIKMLIVEWVHIPSWVSLVVILGVLATATLTSWYKNRLEKRNIR